MRIPSSHMPPRPEAPPIESILAAVLALGYFTISAWTSLVFVTAMVVLVGAWSKWPRMPKPVTSPTGATSICTFARSLNPREVAPWIIRAVYEELTDLYGCPVRAEDRFHCELHADPEDLDYAVRDIAKRAGRSLRPTGQAKHLRSMVSVRDLALFLNQQPRLAGDNATV